MMRIWLSKNCAVSLRDQLATQLMLGIISEDLKAGERLPSVRELARRCHIHSNTASAAYRDLAARGWLEFRRGSGVYVRDLRGSPPIDEHPLLHELIERFFADTRARGFRMCEVRTALSTRLDAAPVRRLVVVEPEPELCQILVSELRERLSIPVSGQVLEKSYSPDLFAGAAVAALVSRANTLRAALPAGIPYHLLRSRSIPEYLQGQPRPKPDALIAVASSSPEILRMTRTILMAAALDPEALEFRDAREDGWQRGLHLCEFVITDVVTAPRISAKCKKRPIRVLPDSSLEGLKSFLHLLTDPEG
jgi:DNA-binding transcriptional regulator YhcF (GntR family)